MQVLLKSRAVELLLDGCLSKGAFPFEAEPLAALLSAVAHPSVPRDYCHSLATAACALGAVSATDPLAPAPAAKRSAAAALALALKGIPKPPPAKPAEAPAAKLKRLGGELGRQEARLPTTSAPKELCKVCGCGGRVHRGAWPSVLWWMAVAGPGACRCILRFCCRLRHQSNLPTLSSVDCVPSECRFFHLPLQVYSSILELLCGQLDVLRPGGGAAAPVVPELAAALKPLDELRAALQARLQVGCGPPLLLGGQGCMPAHHAMASAAGTGLLLAANVTQLRWLSFSAGGDGSQEACPQH